MGPRAVEVIAKFADGVVATRRLAGTRPRSTRPLGIGVALVIAGVALFVAEIITRGSLVMLPLDGAIFGLVLAIAGFVLASIGGHRRGEPDADAFWLGQSPGVDVAVDVPGLSPDERLAVVRRTDHGIELRFVPGMRGTLVRDGDEITLQALADEGPARANADGTFGVPFGDATRAELSCGPIDLLVQPADGVPDAPRAHLLDGRFAIATLLAATIVGGTITVAHFVMPKAQTLPDQEDRPVVYPERAPYRAKDPPRRRYRH